MCAHATLLLLFAHKKPSSESKVNKYIINLKGSLHLQQMHFKHTTNTKGNLLSCLNQRRLCAKPALVWCVRVCVCSGIGCVYLVRGVRQISWCVTGAIKVVALDTAHEQYNDSRLMLISLRLAPSWGAGLFCCRAGLRANRQANRGDAERSRAFQHYAYWQRPGSRPEKKIRKEGRTEQGTRL